MGLYGERVFPRIMNVVMNTKETRQIRERVCAPLRGDVVEIGFGTGHNLPLHAGGRHPASGSGATHEKPLVASPKQASRSSS